MGGGGVSTNLTNVFKSSGFFSELAPYCFRTTRTNLDELVLHLNKTIREFMNEGNEKVETLREDDVSPAVKIVSDYRLGKTSFHRFVFQKVSFQAQSLRIGKSCRKIDKGNR